MGGQYVMCGLFFTVLDFDSFNFDLKNHLEVIVLGIVGVTTLPVIIKVVTHRAKKA